MRTVRAVFSVSFERELIKGIQTLQRCMTRGLGTKKVCPREAEVLDVGDLSFKDGAIFSQHSFELGRCDDLPESFAIGVPMDGDVWSRARPLRRHRNCVV